MPTGPWLSTVCHIRASKRYYGLMRRSDELPPAWAFRLTLDGLCPYGPFASPSLLYLVILSIHAATSTPLADRVRLMAHPSVLRAFTAPNTVRRFQEFLLAGFSGGACFRDGSLLVLLRPVCWLERLTRPRRRTYATDRPARLRQSLPRPGSPPARVCYDYSAQPSIAEAGLSPASMSKTEGCTLESAHPRPRRR